MINLFNSLRIKTVIIIFHLTLTILSFVFSRARAWAKFFPRARDKNLSAINPPLPIYLFFNYTPENCHPPLLLPLDTFVCTSLLAFERNFSLEPVINLSTRLSVHLSTCLSAFAMPRDAAIENIPDALRAFPVTTHSERVQTPCRCNWQRALVQLIYSNLAPIRRRNRNRTKRAAGRRTEGKNNGRSARGYREREREGGRFHGSPHLGPFPIPFDFLSLSFIRHCLLRYFASSQVYGSLGERESYSEGAARD